MNLKKMARRFTKQDEAVSPVVATLMLVLVAAGAAVSLSLFMNNVQDDAQENADFGTQDTVLRIGGSSTVYEFTSAALADFELANPTVSIELESGGSGAGRAAVCKGFVDLGSSSSSWKSGDYDACEDNLGKPLNIVEVAKDAVAMVYKSGNGHACSGLDLTKAQVAELYRVNGAGGDRALDATTNDLFGNTGGSGAYTWADIGCSGTEVIQMHDRSDPGGTEDGFCSKVYAPGYTAAVAFDDDNSIAGFTPCSGGELTSAHTNVDGGDGNQGIHEEMGDDSLSFIGFGFVETATDLTATTLEGVEASGDTIGDESYPAVRSLTYGWAGDASPIEQLFLDFVLNTHNNQEFAAAAGYVSIY